HLAKMAERAGLEWEAAQARLEDESWREQVQKHREELESLGLWGVPAFRYGNLVLWGQDRLWALEKAVLAGSPNSG
ncbi:MAG TPA: DsbA family protein, partial [Dongiaceae bacterium]|nr:DsbA family protein [Dongiaceae bacterium]